MSSKKPRQKASPQECAILCEDASGVRVIGGQKIGYPSNHRTTFYHTRQPNRQPSVGIRIMFPRSSSTDVSFFDYEGHLSTTLAIEIRLHAGTWTSTAEEISPELEKKLPKPEGKTNPMCLLRFKLKDGETASVDGIGLPFVAECEDDNLVVNCGHPLDGVWTLRELSARREFAVLFGGYRMMPRGRTSFVEDFPDPVQPVFPYSTGSWSMTRYESEVPANAKSHSYTLSYKFDNHHDYMVSVAQGVVQDVFQLAQDARAIRQRNVVCLFLRTSDKPDDLAREFTVLVWHGFTEQDKFWPALSRLLSPDSPIALAFDLPPPDAKYDDSEEGTKDRDFWEARQVPMEDEWKGANCDLALRIRRPRQKDINSIAFNRPIRAYDDFNAGQMVGYDGSKYYLKLDAGLHVARRRVEAVYAALEETEPLDEHKHNIKKEFQAGAGFRSLLGTHALASSPGGDGVESATTSFANMTLAASPPTSAPPTPTSAPPTPTSAPPVPPSPSPPAHLLRLPEVDIFDAVDRKIRAAVGKRVSDKARLPFLAYLKATRLGIVGIVGFAGSGKTQLLALTARLYMAHPAISKLACSAPTHVATSNFAARLHRLGVEIAKETNTPSPLVVRGYAIKTEIAAFIKIAAGQSRGAEGDIVDPYKTGRWSLSLSPCEWLLKVVGAKGFSLAASDPEVLRPLQRSVQADRKFEGLRQFVAGKISFSEVENNTPNDVHAETAYQMVRRLLEDIIMVADAVCATPFGLSQAPYAQFNRKVAKGVVLDEAGAMLQADALLVWGGGCRPCIMAGDPKQLPPTVMSHGETRNGNMVNMFSEFAKVSQLEQVMRMGWPCFVLNVQFRIVAGSFDLARKIIYNEVKGFEYAAKAAVSENPVAAKIEMWVETQYRAEASPAGKILPLFFNCVGSKCLKEEGGSRYNPQQNTAAVRLVERLLGANLGLSGSDVVIITPYRGNFDRLQAAFSTHALPACRSVVVNTTDSFQGREGLVVVFVPCVTAETGPLFVADPHRICVGVTRQIGALFVVGDINTLRPQGKKEAKNPRNNTINGLLDYFRETKRVVHLGASGNVITH